ncbi:MAG: DUF3592 domain-containing protein [Spirochaetales bacterium]|nr:DUF3592 domain-containing protein [Spirochaetales bacterium]
MSNGHDETRKNGSIKNKNLELKLFSLILAILPVFLFCDFVNRIPKWTASSSWTETKGTVLDLSFRETEDEERHISYNVYIKYQYIINEKKYIGENMNLGSLPWNVNGKQKQWFMEHYKIGNTVPVYFNPDSLSEAVLVRGIAGGEYIKIIYTVLFLGISIFLFIQSFGNSKKNQAKGRL